jgi:hypothetical protein
MNNIQFTDSGDNIYETIKKSKGKNILNDGINIENSVIVIVYNRYCIIKNESLVFINNDVQWEDKLTQYETNPDCDFFPYSPIALTYKVPKHVHLTDEKINYMKKNKFTVLIVNKTNQTRVDYIDYKIINVENNTLTFKYSKRKEKQVRDIIPKLIKQQKIWVNQWVYVEYLDQTLWGWINDDYCICIYKGKNKGKNDYKCFKTPTEFANHCIHVLQVFTDKDKKTKKSGNKVCVYNEEDDSYSTLIDLYEK